MVQQRQEPRIKPLPFTAVCVFCLATPMQLEPGQDRMLRCTWFGCHWSLANRSGCHGNAQAKVGGVEIRTGLARWERPHFRVMGMHSHYNSEWVPGGYAWDVQQVVFPSGLFKQTLFLAFRSILEFNWENKMKGVCHGLHLQECNTENHVLLKRKQVILRSRSMWMCQWSKVSWAWATSQWSYLWRRPALLWRPSWLRWVSAPSQRTEWSCTLALRWDELL